MTNNLEYLVRHINNDIPPEIINYGFVERSSSRLVNLNPTFLVSSKVIRDIVVVDCNIVAGEEMMVPLRDANVITLDNGIIVEIPDRALGNKEIVNPLTLDFEGGTGIANNPVVGAAIGPKYLGSSKVELVARNSVFLEGVYSHIGGWLRCNVSNETDFSNVPRPALVDLGRLCTLATKAYIYNQRVVDTNRAPIINGVESPIIGDIINSYNDSRSLYLDYLQEVWPKVFIMSDPRAHRGIIRLMMGAR